MKQAKVADVLSLVTVQTLEDVSGKQTTRMEPSCKDG